MKHNNNDWIHQSFDFNQDGILDQSEARFVENTFAKISEAGSFDEQKELYEAAAAGIDVCNRQDNAGADELTPKSYAQEQKEQKDMDAFFILFFIIAFVCPSFVYELFGFTYRDLPFLVDLLIRCSIFAGLWALLVKLKNVGSKEK